jgi:hypothetical protein
MADLITVAEYKAFQGIDPTDTRDDARLAALLPAISRLIRTFTGRQFDVTTGIATARTFLYDNTGMLEIDDCTVVSGVSTDAGVAGQTYALDSSQWTAMPQDDSDVFYYLVVGGGPFFGMSPEMGFNRNLDQYPLIQHNAYMTVTATWGWTAIPEDVKLAAAWTAREALSRRGDSSASLSSEAIAGYSRSWGGQAPTSTALAVPGDARDLLAAYERLYA